MRPIILFLLALVLAAAAPAAAQDAPFVPVWIDKTAQLSDADVTAAVDAIAAQKPDHVVVLVHGFATPRADSTAQFTQMATLVRNACTNSGKRVAVLGIQWDSALPRGNVIGEIIGGMFGFLQDDPYTSKVRLARDVGRNGGRQLVLALNERLPSARVDVFAHSLGSEVTRFVIDPGATDELVKEPKAFRPEQQVNLELVCLAGADLDYDLMWRNRDRIHEMGGVDLYWLTLGGAGLRPRDAVLDLRNLIRGRAAMGDRFPRFSEQQIDVLCSSAHLVLDTRRIPVNHAILSYYDGDRIGRLCQTAIALGDASKPSPILAQIQAVLTAPPTVEAIQPYLDDEESSVQFYAFWRLESLLCGGPQHICEAYSERIIAMLRSNPAAIAEERPKSECVTVRNGLWPTQRQINKSVQAQPSTPASIRTPLEP